MRHRRELHRHRRFTRFGKPPSHRLRDDCHSPLARYQPERETVNVSIPQLDLVELDGSVGSGERRASIVVGHDRGPESNEVLVVALDLARRLTAHLHIVHAVDLRDYPIDPELDDWEDHAREKLAEERIAVRLAMRSHDWGWTFQIGRGDPAKLLIGVANEHNALMIAVGSRGEGLHVLLERFLSTSVSHRLIQYANRPVLVVRHGGTSPGL